MKTWDEVVEGYRERWIKIFSQGVEGFSKQACREIVYALTPKTGKWIFNPKDAIDLMFTLPKCNKCGFESSDGGNFCPNCGARMEGSEE